MPFIMLDQLADRRRAALIVHDVIAEQHRKRFIPDELPGRMYRMPQPLRLLLPDIENIGEAGGMLDLPEKLVLPFVLKDGLEFHGLIEIVLDRPLVLAGDEGRQSERRDSSRDSLS